MKKQSYNLFSIFLFSTLLFVGSAQAGSAPAGAQESVAKLPIVYHPDYNISFGGLEKLHPFDSAKYGRVYNYLLTLPGISAQRFYQPKDEITRDELLKVHAAEYLDSLLLSSTVADVTEIEILAQLPNCLLQSSLLKPMRLATRGTVAAAFLALKHGWSINLSGGYHHAKSNKGEGFCVYADIPLACKLVFEEYQGIPDCPKKILIVDLDAHQGNGHEMICGPDERVDIFDIYNGGIYPNDKDAKVFINYDFPVKSGIKDAEYLGILRRELPKAFNKSDPDLIIYNAGTDPFEKDRLGAMGISEKGIIERDRFVFEQAFIRGIPIAMVLSGGYTKDSATIIGHSVQRIIKQAAEHEITVKSPAAA